MGAPGTTVSAEAPARSGRSGPLAALMSRWAARDPRFYALRRALRAAVVIPVNFAIGSVVIGDPQVATLCAFGSFALLLFVEFPGSLATRAGAYGMLAAVGAVLVTLGTELSRPAWLAVLSMAVIGFVILFAGAVSSMIAVAGRAALLTFILPVMLPGTRADVPHRLLGWGIACAVAIPVALFVWPPRDQNRLRRATADLCHALGHALALDATGGPPGNKADSGEPGGTDAPTEESPWAATGRAVHDMRRAFRMSAARPVALSTGSRLLVRLVDELEWLTTTAATLCAEGPERWSDKARRLRMAATDAMHACASVLSSDGSGPERVQTHDLDAKMARLAEARQAVAAETLAELRAATRTDRDPGTVPGGEFDRPLYAAHELGYLVARACATVALIAAADSRTWFDRLLGRPGAPGVPSEPAAAERIVADSFGRNSVWLQNSVRGAAGLAAAVLIARVSGVQEGFWIVLGALSVLRSNALSTGATALRAVAGTAVGFAVGGLIVAGLGTNPAVLWPLLPVAILVAAYTPDVISFAAGQAAFTVVVIILFNIIAPVGWRLGVLRIEDVALGCAAGVIAGLLFWPRGAGPALGAALGEAYRTGAAHLGEAIDYVTGRRAALPSSFLDAKAAGLRVDAAFRQYLAERGAKNIPLASVTALANGAARLRLAGEAIALLNTDIPVADGPALASPVALLVEQADRVSGWYRSLGEVVAGAGGSVPAIRPTPPDQSFLDVVLPAVDRCGDPGRAERAERLLWSGQYLGDVTRLRDDLVEPVQTIDHLWQRTLAPR